MKKENNYVVYLIQMGDTEYYKIGITKDLNKRLASLQTGNPLPLRVATTIQFYNELNNTHYAREMEKQYHKIFDYCRANGEWFKFSFHEQDSIIKMSQKYIIDNINNWFLNFTELEEIIQKSIKKYLDKWEQK